MMEGKNKSKAAAFSGSSSSRASFSHASLQDRASVAEGKGRRKIQGQRGKQILFPPFLGHVIKCLFYTNKQIIVD